LFDLACDKADNYW